MVWATTVVAATAIIKKRREILFMLNLMRWKRVSEASAYLDAKPPGERCLYSTARNVGMEKNTAGRGKVEEPEVQGPWILLIVDFLIAD